MVWVWYQAGPWGRVPFGVNGEGSRGSSSMWDRSTSQEPGIFGLNLGVWKWSGGGEADDQAGRGGEEGGVEV